MNYPLTQRRPNVTDEMLERLQNLVPPVGRGLRKKCDFEVLVFTTPVEWEMCNDETDFKTKIRAKFRLYDEAEDFAQRLLADNVHYHKVLIRL